MTFAELLQERQWSDIAKFLLAYDIDIEKRNEWIAFLTN